MNTAHIRAIETALPEQVVTNEALALNHPDWRMADVARRTGVTSRRWCRADETALDLAATAVERLLQRVGAAVAEVDTILFCTQTPDFVMPANACLLQDRLRFPTTVAALDFTHACSGFLYGLYLAKAIVESGNGRQVLLVTAETYSKRFSHDDRGPATLFGDGAAATLVCAGAAGLGRVSLATDGSAYRAFYVPGGGARPSSAVDVPPPDRHGTQRGACHLFMDGAAVLSFVTRELPPHVLDTMAQAGLTWSDLDLVVFHQASKVSMDALVRALGIPPALVFSNISHVGNTVSASIPIALRDAELAGRLLPGSRVLLVGFGVGMSWGSTIITWHGTK